MTRIAVLAAGAMGAGMGLRLREHGATVLTNLDGRGAASRARAAEAGMADVPLDEIAGADLVLSIVPPGSAVELAERLAPALRAGAAKPVFVDLNAVAPATVERVRAALDGTGCAVVDGCIIGAPPKARMTGQSKSPAVYVSGDPDGLTAPLARHGIDLWPMEAGFGAASALKLVYAMCTKGVTALAAGMFLAAEREGAGDALRAELARSQPELVERFGKAMPDMLPKAYRWVAEMREIAILLGPDDPTAAMLEGAARVYERLAADGQGSGELGRALLGASAPR
ncbi:NAD(P)-dependent oxidoreductase [Lichenibacterium dinghuense]|uniref:NAD(P)-dependent oxidoreductase n=1 Tax=Lichenibacterium dinghuense TaxID=2895977 RepID=UPI001F2E8C1D|nr:NAD(P)-dependent oxidoreductase [Lichenibacterium sp. 6Y81]